MENDMIKKTGASSLIDYGTTAMLYPILAVDREVELVAQFQAGCTKARTELIHSHMRFVMTIARQLGGGRSDREDLIQEGMVGLMVALENFNLDAGVRISMYAAHWIKSAIRQYMMDTKRIFRIATTKPQRKLYYNLYKFNKEGRIFNQREVENIAEFLSVTVEDVREMEKKLIGSDLPIHADDDDDKAALLDSLYDEDCDPALIVEQEDWSKKLSINIESAFSTLDPRSRGIINDRWLVKDTKTLQELGAIHNVSNERIRQLEGKAMKAVKQNLQQFAA